MRETEGATQTVEEGDSAATTGMKSGEVAREEYIRGWLVCRGWTIQGRERRRENTAGRVARAWCLVFIVPANWSITDSDTAQFGNPRRRSQPTRITLIPPFAFSSVRPQCFCQPLSLGLGLSISPSTSVPSSLSLY